MPSQPLEHAGMGPDPDQATEGRAWWKVCCTGCCLGVAALFVVIPLLLQFVFNAAPEKVARVPDSYPSQMLLFRPEEAAEILYYPAASKGKVARLLSGPLALIQRIPLPESMSSSTSADQIGRVIREELRRVEGRDTVAVRWSSLNATRDEVLRFYAGALKQAGMPQAQTRRDAAANLDELLSQRPDMRFSLLLTDDPSIRGVENVSVVVEYVVEQK
jgi:hypothetical protein